MTGKIQLIFIGALLFLVVLSASENSKDDSLTEEGVKARLTRAAKSDSGRKKSQIKKKSKKVDKRRKKSKKSKKMAKRKKQKKNKSNKYQKSQPKQEIPDSCLKKSVDGLYKGYFKKASNFDRQSKRIETGVPIIAKKLQKAGDFNQSAEAIASIASSCLTFEERIEALSLAAELGACYQNITDSCQPPEVNQTRIEECKPFVEGFQNETEVCKDLYGDDACDCWQGPDFETLYENLSGCVIKDSETNVTNRLKECKQSISYCNKAQREAFSLYAQCNQECLVGSTPITPKVGQQLGFIPRWGPFFKIKLEVLIETYEYFYNDGFNWGQIVRFQALNGTGAEGADHGGDCCDVGSRVPSIWAKVIDGENWLQVTSAIFNNYTVENDLAGNNVFNFTGVDAPDVDKYFTITITQLPPVIQFPPTGLSLPSEFTVSIEQEGKATQVQSAPNYDPLVFKDVTVWSIDDIPAADQYQEYVPINGNIKNLCIWK